MIKEWEELNAKMTSPLTTEEYFQFRDVLATLLIRNSEALLELVKAAKKHVVKRGLDDDHPLREALAALGEK